MFNSIVEAVFHYADKNPDAFCLADDNVKLTYGEYKGKILKYAAVLKNLGTQKGDKVILEACQTTDYLAIQSALWLLGAIFVPLEHNCAADKIRSFIDRVSPKFVVVQNETDFKNVKSFTFDELANSVKDSAEYTVSEFPKADDISEILFSTGTTGREKGIVITHKNNIALALNVINGVEMEKDNVEMIPSPLNHSHGLRRYYANMYNGCAVVILGSVMDIMRFFKNLTEYSVTAVDLVPSALTVVLKLSKTKLSEFSDQLRYIQYGAAPLNEQDKQKVCALLPKTRMYNFYGSTESGCTCIYNFNVPAPKQNCIGKPTYSTTVLVVDDNKNPIGSDKDNTGLIATKGNMNMSYYYEDENETAKVLLDGVVYSNDIGYIDADGDIILLGRKGDVINVGGNKVAPDEIEDAAKQMKDIADCGCIPVADAAKGQVPKLIVQMKKGREFNPVEIRKFLQASLEPYKVPQYIDVIDEIPRSFNGKLLRKNLK